MQNKTLEQSIMDFMEQFQDDMYPALHDGIMGLINKSYDTGYRDYQENMRLKKLLDNSN